MGSCQNKIRAMVDVLFTYLIGPLLHGEKLSRARASPPPSRLNFSERLYEKKVDPLPESRAGFTMTTVLERTLIFSS